MIGPLIAAATAAILLNWWAFASCRRGARQSCLIAYLASVALWCASSILLALKIAGA